MSKRSKARNRHLGWKEREAPDPDGFENKIPAPKSLAPVLDVTSTQILDKVAEVVERASTDPVSKQPRFVEPTGLFSSVYRWVNLANLKEPSPRDPVRTWDAWMRQFGLAEPYLAGVINSVVAIDKNRGWSITGGRNQVRRYTDILHGVDGGTGWRAYATWQAQSYYMTRMGFVSEIGTDGPEGPLRALWSVDPTRCELTGDPAHPLRYFPSLGSTQQWLPTDFFRAASLMSTDESLHGLGYPALARCLDLAKIMVAIYEYDKEQLGAKAPKGLLLLHGISDTDWQTAMQAREEALTGLEREYYGGVAVLATTGASEIKAELVALSQLPKDFDLQQFTNLLMYGYALAFGYDPREFWPVSGGQLGTALETETQHRKASSKGDLDFSLAHQECLQRLLPPTLQFEYQQRDVQGEISDSGLQLAKAQVITEMTKWLINTSSVLTSEQVLQLAASADIIPEEWTLVEEEVTATDTDETELTARAAIQRARDMFPDEPIVRYEFPGGKMRQVLPPRNQTAARRSHPVAEIPPAITRNVEGMLAEYDSALTSLVRQTMRGDLSVNEMAAQMRELIRGMAASVYFEGMAEGGVDQSEADDSDYQVIADWIQTQLPSVRSLAKDAEAAGPAGHANQDARNAVYARVDLWLVAMRDLGSQGRLRAQKNAMLTFTGPDGMESCKTCQKYKGQRHRANWWVSRGLVPSIGNEMFECGGWKCQHYLQSDTGQRFAGNVI